MVLSEFCIVSLEGEYDISNADQLNVELERTYLEPHVIIDFTNVRYFDSSAIGMLFRKRRARAQHRFSPGVLVGLRPNVRRVFELVGMNEIWPFAQTLDEARHMLAHDDQ